MAIPSKFVLGLALISCLIGCVHKIPPEYEWERGWVLDRAERPVFAKSLSGTVFDASGAPLEFALVELMTSDFKTRLDARITRANGRFRFHQRGRRVYLRFRMKGFNDYEVPVEITKKADARQLRIQMAPSD
jgi:hypothetical protein